MTTAHRPTFDPAKGKADHRQTLIYHARNLPGHTKLKHRQNNSADDNDKETLRDTLLRAEAKHFAELLETSHDDNADDQQLDWKERLLMETRDMDADDSNWGQDQPSDDNNDKFDDDDDDDDDDDETAELLRELEKIKQQRAALKAKEEQERLENETVNREKTILQANPIMRNDFVVKRRWDEEVVFKNQYANDTSASQRKEFINDTLRSEFHKKFMKQYMK